MRTLPGWRAQPHLERYVWAETFLDGRLVGRLTEEPLLGACHLLVTWQFYGGDPRVLQKARGKHLDKFAQRGLELLAKHSAALRLGWRP